MKSTLCVAALSLATAMALALPALAAETAQNFVTKAAIGGMFEVQSSKVAQDKLQDPNLKDFARKMISDHGAANAKLESIAGEQKLQVPADLDAAHKGDVEKLQSASAPVDASYADMQKTAHADAVSLFESYAKDGDNAALKSFASETLPTLKMHQEMIQKVATTAPASGGTTPAVTSGETNPAAPVPGANSFTEAQAKTAIEKAGYADVSALTKDDKGIWRGTATKDGKSTPIALDYQGNVVAGTN
jgi:putative membrane protein